ncbi:hypothetical protein M413DRAFT_348195 [Hebeloma cylindrosporum]|uniref:Uncharacterized protein n=1 Tax=Hebeloma cylindrosporum TaxID=76867 RepID=A0A0C3BVR5_HEBCY|nr:hypothetical protein M413DRAFT_348195 [Hebeloma cylindrosporum h7]
MDSGALCRNHVHETIFVGTNAPDPLPIGRGLNGSNNAREVEGPVITNKKEVTNGRGLSTEGRYFVSKVS